MRTLIHRFIIIYFKSQFKMLNFEQGPIINPEKTYNDSFEFGINNKKKTLNVYEKCAFQCVNLTYSLTQQEANCIQMCYSKEFNNTAFKDAKLYL